MAILNKHNSDDVFFRALSVALIDILHNKVKIWNQFDDDTRQEISIPFFFNESGDERFMQDIFLQQTRNDLIDRKIVEGNIDVLPRGIITPNSISINANSLTNRFIYGEFTKEIEGELKTFVAPTNMIPLEVSYEVEIRVESRLTGFKLLQQLIRTFYKVKAFKFLFEGYVIQAQVSFPEDAPLENTYEFSFGDPTQGKINFSLAVETYLPIIDSTQIRSKDNVIEDFQINWDVQNVGFNKNNQSITKIIETINDNVYRDPTQGVTTTVIGQYDGQYTDNSTSTFDTITQLNRNTNDGIKGEELTQLNNVSTLRGNLGYNIFRNPPENQVEYKPDFDKSNIDNNIHNVGNFGIYINTLDNTVNMKKNGLEL